MTTTEHQAQSREEQISQKKRDILWITAGAVLCGGWAAYLFVPYFLPQLKTAGPASAGIGLVVAVIVAAIGAFSMSKVE